MWRKRSPLEKASREANAYRFLYTLYDRSVRPSLDPGQPSDGLNHGQRVIFNLYWFAAEVNNGAFTQYVWNSAGDYVGELVEHLDLLAQPALADAVREYLRVVFPNGRVPTDTRERRELMEAFFDTTPFNFNDDPKHMRELETMPDPDPVTPLFHSTETTLMEALREWAIRHPSYFA